MNWIITRNGIINGMKSDKNFCCPIRHDGEKGKAIMKELEAQILKITEMAANANLEVMEATEVTSIDAIVKRAVEEIKGCLYTGDAFYLSGTEYEALRNTAQQAAEMVKESRWTWALREFGKKEED